MKLTKERAEHYLLQMYQIRAFEEQAEKSYMAGKIHGTMHLSIGQEASAVGSISTLEPTDFIIGHGDGVVPCISLMWLAVTWERTELSVEGYPSPLGLALA